MCSTVIPQDFSLAFVALWLAGSSSAKPSAEAAVVNVCLIKTLSYSLFLKLPDLFFTSPNTSI